MKNRYLNSIKSSALSILPILLIVLFLSIPGIGIVKLTGWDYLMLGIGGVTLIFGLALFQIGAATGITKVGEYMGTSLSKQPKLFIVILFALALGTLITCAEPSILIFSKQVTIVKDNPSLNAIVLIGSIALGVGLFVVIGVLRIIFQKSLKVWYLFFYMICFIIQDFTGNEKAYCFNKICRATCTPLALAWLRLWVTPLPSPMIYRPS